MNTPWPLLFEVPTPLGFTVCTTADYWQRLVGKHPDLADRLDDVKATLRQPEQVRQSRRDPAVLLFLPSRRPPLGRGRGQTRRRHGFSGDGLPNQCDKRRRTDMAQIKVHYEPDLELLTVFWQAPRPNQICTELDDGVVLIKDGQSGQPIGVELLSYKPGDARFDGVAVELSGKGSLLPA